MADDGARGGCGGGRGGGMWSNAEQVAMEGGGSDCGWSSEAAASSPPTAQMILSTSLEVMQWVGDSSEDAMEESGASSRGGRGSERQRSKGRWAAAAVHHFRRPRHRPHCTPPASPALDPSRAASPRCSSSLRLTLVQSEFRIQTSILSQLKMKSTPSTSSVGIQKSWSNLVLEYS